jgi:hypothetical protein
MNDTEYHQIYPPYKSDIIAVKNIKTGVYLIAPIELLYLYVQGDVISRSSTNIRTSKGFISKVRHHKQAIKRCRQLIERAGRG